MFVDSWLALFFILMPVVLDVFAMIGWAREENRREADRKRYEGEIEALEAENEHYKVKVLQLRLDACFDAARKYGQEPKE